MTKAPSVSQMWDGAALFFALRMICAAAAGRNALNVKLREGARRLRYAAVDERRMVIAGRLAACGERWMAVVGQCLPLKCKKHIRDKQATGALAERLATTAICGG